MRAAPPPRWMEALLRAFSGGMTSGDALVGDLAEGYGILRGRRGAILANLWYLRESATVAIHAALAALGRAARRGGNAPLEPLRRDLRWTARSMARRPWFGLAVLAILTLAVGANTAAVSLLAGTYRAATWWSGGAATVSLWPEKGMSLGQLLTLRQEHEALGEIGAWVAGTSSVEDDTNGARSVASVALSPNLFDALSVQPALGRGLAPGDEEPGNEPVVVISHSLWRTAFGGDPSAVGATLRVDGVARRIVGVQGRGGEAPGVGTQVWTPIVLDVMDPDFWPRQDYSLVARLPPTTTVDAAREDLVRVMGILARRFSFFYPPDFGQDATVAPANEPVWGPLRGPLTLLMAGTLLLLVVAAIDLGNLFLGRALERDQELRIRSVLGASRGRLVSQLLMEGFLWTAAGLACGVAAGLAIADRLALVFPVGSQVVSLGAGGSLWLFAAAMGALIWALMSGVPIASFLRSTRHGVLPRRFGGQRAQATLVVAQATLATALLVGAGLLVRSVDNMRRIPLGFDGRDVVAVKLSPQPGDFDEAGLRAFYRQVETSLASAPGVRSVGLSATLPLRDAVPASPVNRLDAPQEVSAAPRAFRHVVDAGWFGTLRMRVVRGRGLEEGDREGEAPVVVVNETMAEALWPGQDPIGRQVALDPHDWMRWLTVVGVVSDARYRDLTFPVAPAYYVPHAQSPSREMYVFAAGPLDAATLAGIVRSAVTVVDPRVALGPPWPMARVVADSFGAVRIMMALLVVLAVLATVLGAVGLYGALASYVTRHRVELSTRIALGARPQQIFGRMIAAGALLTGSGVVLGSLVAMAGGGLVRSLLFGVSPLDPVSFVAPAAILGLTGVLAAALPALRAAWVAPAQVMREG